MEADKDWLGGLIKVQKNQLHIFIKPKNIKLALSILSAGFILNHFIQFLGIGIPMPSAITWIWLIWAIMGLYIPSRIPFFSMTFGKIGNIYYRVVNNSLFNRLYDSDWRQWQNYAFDEKVAIVLRELAWEAKCNGEYNRFNKSLQGLEIRESISKKGSGAAASIIKIGINHVKSKGQLKYALRHELEHISQKQDGEIKRWRRGKWFPWDIKLELKAQRVSTEFSSCRSIPQNLLRVPTLGISLLILMVFEIIDLFREPEAFLNQENRNLSNSGNSIDNNSTMLYSLAPFVLALGVLKIGSFLLIVDPLLGILIGLFVGIVLFFVIQRYVFPVSFYLSTLCNSTLEDLIKLGRPALKSLWSRAYSLNRSNRGFVQNAIVGIVGMPEAIVENRDLLVRFSEFDLLAAESRVLAKERLIIIDAPQWQYMIHKLKEKDMQTHVMIEEAIPAVSGAVAKYFEENDKGEVIGLTIDLGIELANKNILPCSTLEYGMPLAAEFSEGDIVRFKQNLGALKDLAIRLNGRDINSYRTLRDGIKVIRKAFSIGRDFALVLLLAEKTISWQIAYEKRLMSYRGSVHAGFAFYSTETVLKLLDVLPTPALIELLRLEIGLLIAGKERREQMRDREYFERTETVGVSLDIASCTVGDYPFPQPGHDGRKRIYEIPNVVIISEYSISTEIKEDGDCSTWVRSIVENYRITYSFYIEKDLYTYHPLSEIILGAQNKEEALVRLKEKYATLETTLYPATMSKLDLSRFAPEEEFNIIKAAFGNSYGKLAENGIDLSHIIEIVPGLEVPVEVANGKLRINPNTLRGPPEQLKVIFEGHELGHLLGEDETQARSRTLQYLISNNLLASHINFLRNNEIGIVADRYWLEALLSNVIYVFDKSIETTIAGIKQEIGSVDIIVGIPCYDEINNIRKLIRKAQEGLVRYYPTKKSIIVVIGEASKPETIAAAGEMNGEKGIPVVTFVKEPGIQGKKWSERAFFIISKRLNAEAFMLLDADLTITPRWIKKLLGPVLSGEADYVSPNYIRHYHQDDQSLTDHFVFPLFASLYGKRLRQAIGGEFATTARLIDSYLEAEGIWDIPVSYEANFAAIVAVNKGRIKEAWLGRKIHNPNSRYLGDLFRVYARILMDQILRNIDYIGSRLENEDIESIGTREPPKSGVLASEIINIDYREWIEQYKSGFAGHEEFYREKLPTIISVLERLNASGANEFNLTSGEWASIVFAFIKAYRDSSINEREEIVNALRPIFQARVVSFAKEVEGLTYAQMEERLYGQVGEFARAKKLLFGRKSPGIYILKRQIEGSFNNRRIQNYLPYIEKRLNERFGLPRDLLVDSIFNFINNHLRILRDREDKDSRKKRGIDELKKMQVLLDSKTFQVSAFILWISVFKIGEFVWNLILYLKFCIVKLIQISYVSEIMIFFVIHPMARIVSRISLIFSWSLWASEFVFRKTIGVVSRKMFTVLTWMWRNITKACFENETILKIGLDIAAVFIRLFNLAILPWRKMIWPISKVIFRMPLRYINWLLSSELIRGTIIKILKIILRPDTILVRVKFFVTFSSQALRSPGTKSLSFGRLYRYFVWIGKNRTYLQNLRLALSVWLMINILKDKTLEKTVLEHLLSIENYPRDQAQTRENEVGIDNVNTGVSFRELIEELNETIVLSMFAKIILQLFDLNWEELDGKDWSIALDKKSALIRRIQDINDVVEWEECYRVVCNVSVKSAVAQQTMTKIIEELIIKGKDLFKDNNIILSKKDLLSKELQILESKIGASEKLLIKLIMRYAENGNFHRGFILLEEQCNIVIDVLERMPVVYKGSRVDLHRNKLVRLLKEKGMLYSLSSDNELEIRKVLSDLGKLYTERDDILILYTAHGVALQLSDATLAQSSVKETQHVFIVISLASVDRKRLALGGMDAIRRKVMEREDLPSIGLSIDWRIVFVDNTATGEIGAFTESIVRKWYERYMNGKRIFFINTKDFVDIQGNGGKGIALKWGFRWSMLQIKKEQLPQGQTYIFFEDIKTDTNGGYLAALLDAMLRNNVAVAVGSRNLRESFTAVKPNYGFLLSALYNFFVRVQLPSLGSLRDTQCGLKGFRTDVIDQIALLLKEQSWSIDTEMLLLSRLFGHRIIEVPVAYIDSKGPLGYEKTPDFIKDSRIGVRRQRREYGAHIFGNNLRILSKIGNGIEANVYSHPLVPYVVKIEKPIAKGIVRILIKLLRGTENEIKRLSFDVPLISRLLANSGIIGRMVRGFIQKHKSFVKGITAIIESQKRDMFKGYQLAIERMGDLIPQTTIVRNSTIYIRKWWGVEEVRAPIIIIQRKIDIMLKDKLIEAVNKGDAEEAKQLVKKFFELQHKMWSRGCFDHNLKMLDDIGIDEHGQLVLMDVGELIGDYGEAWLELQPERLQEKLRRFDARYFESFAPDELVDYYRSLFFEYLNHEHLRKLWATELHQIHDIEIKNLPFLQEWSLSEKIKGTWEELVNSLKRSQEGQFLPFLGREINKGNLVVGILQNGNEYQKLLLNEMAKMAAYQFSEDRRSLQDTIEEYFLLKGNKLPQLTSNLLINNGINNVELDHYLYGQGVSIEEVRVDYQATERNIDRVVIIEDMDKRTDDSLIASDCHNWAQEAVISELKGRRGLVYNDIPEEIIGERNGDRGKTIICIENQGIGLRQGLLSVYFGFSKGDILIFGRPMGSVNAHQSANLFSSLPKGFWVTICASDNLLIPSEEDRRHMQE